jgi:glycosyltransferase involved in cell wall biosynthesis
MTARSAYYLVPGSLDVATGGTIYDRRMVEGLRALGWRVDVRSLDGPFPESADEDRAAMAAVVSAVPDGSIVAVDGLAVAALADAIERHASRLRFVAVMHLPLGLDPSLKDERRMHLAGEERRALAHASRVVVTGRVSKAFLERAGIAAARIAVVEPGTDPAPAARGGRDDGVHLVCVATVNAVKGHDVLVRSLHRVRELDWQLSCAGSITRDPQTAGSVVRLIELLNLTGRVELRGELPAAAVSTLLDGASVFVLASRFETYGMAAAEALARGLPIVATRTGELPSIAGDEAGRFVPPGDEDALTEALRCAIGNPQVRARMREAAVRARDRLRPWTTAVRRFGEVLAEACDDG